MKTVQARLIQDSDRTWARIHSGKAVEWLGPFPGNAEAKSAATELARLRGWNLEWMEVVK